MTEKLTRASWRSRVTGQLGVYTAVVLLERAASLAVLPFYTRALTPAMYGMMELLDLTTNVVGMLMAMRLCQAVAFFFHGAPDPRTRNRYISTALMVSLSAGVLIALSMLAFAPDLSELVFGTRAQAGAFRLLSITLAATFPIETVLGVVRASGMAWIYSAATVTRLAISVTLMLVLTVWLKMGVTGWLWSSLTSALVVGVSLAVYAVRRWGARLDLSDAWAMFRYSWPLNVSAIGMFIIHFGDRWFLRRAIPLEALGVYSLGYKLGMLIAFVQAPFSLFWSSQMFAISVGEGGKERHVRVATYTTFVYGLATVLLANIADPFLKVWVGPGFRSAATFVPVVALAYMIRAQGEFFRSSFQLHGRTGWDALVTWAGALACLTGYVFLIPAFGAWGALITTFGTFVIMLGLSIWKGQQVAPYPYQWRRLVSIVLITALFASVPLVSKPTTIIEGLLECGLALSGFVLLVLVCRVLSGEDIALVKSAYRAVRLKFTRQYAHAGVVD